MDLEKTRLFVQQLFAPPPTDAGATVALLSCLRNAVIGNNKQKTNVIALGSLESRLWSGYGIATVWGGAIH